MAHITGGGITENLPRVLPEGTAAEVDTRAWTTPPIFVYLQQRGRIATAEMFRAFNMGIGLIVVCAAADAQSVLDELARAECASSLIGRVIPGARDVRYR
jgi:phosphoribosylformylglycinamidine cyclo-ligase